MTRGPGVPSVLWSSLTSECNVRGALCALCAVWESDPWSHIHTSTHGHGFNPRSHITGPRNLISDDDWIIAGLDLFFMTWLRSRPACGRGPGPRCLETRPRPWAAAALGPGALTQLTHTRTWPMSWHTSELTSSGVSGGSWHSYTGGTFDDVSSRDTLRVSVTPSHTPGSQQRRHIPHVKNYKSI